ncbi:FecR family protein [Chitinophaga sp. Hz27]|uniref:FecR family protein n=1 Tax=Chitinophaga sp. Hz27 TaxID=3347169 RepID=UPI0035DA113D
MERKSIAEKYSQYNEHDFLTDPYFQEWVYAPTPEIEAYWQQVSVALPLKKTDIDHAYLYLKNISFKQHIPSDEAAQASWEKHLQLIRAQESIQSKATPVRNFTYSKAWKIAAIVAGIAVITAAYIFFPRAATRITAQTGFGEIRQVTLPDGSLVDLNANSSISYNSKWKTGEKREIWLKGEALFNVVHINKDTNNIKDQERFLVHTKDLTVTVLGTVFDVRQRRQKTEVALQSGKIRLSFENADKEDLILQPGDFISYNEEDKKTSAETIAAEKFSSWKDRKLMLNNPSVSEILKYLEDTFGKKIIMEDKTLDTKIINGPILLNSLDDALFVLSTVLHTQVIKKDTQTIILRTRPI